jgi:nickel/cobalt exporter
VRLAAVSGLVLALLGAGTAAWAHPLGNFTTNGAVGITVAPEQVRVDRVLDLAEIPATRALQAVDADGDDDVSPAESEAYAASLCAELAASLTVEVDGATLDLALVDPPTFALPPGEAGLVTLRLECPLGATTRPLASGTRRVEVRDDSYPDRLGWREATATGHGVTLISSDVPEASPSERLVDYPDGVAPPDVRSASLEVRAGGPAAELPLASVVPEPVARGLDRVSGRFTALVAVERITVPFALLALLIAAGLGTLHALAPGHGKTVMAAYLVGQRGSRRDALVLGATVAVTHTLGVFALGLVLTLVTAASPARIYPWLGAASGLLFAAVGVTLLRQARGGDSHGHGPGGHAHTPDGRTVRWEERHDHRHDHDHGHDHEHHHDDHEHGHEHSAAASDRVGPRSAVAVVDPQPSAPTTGTSRRAIGRGLVVPGLAGGLVPSPSALLVLLGGAATGRTLFGVVLVIAYGVGMAVSLVGAGYLLLRLRGRLERAGDGPTPRLRSLAALTRSLPVVTASLIIVGGLAIAVRSLAGA